MAPTKAHAMRQAISSASASGLKAMKTSWSVESLASVLTRASSSDTVVDLTLSELGEQSKSEVPQQTIAAQKSSLSGRKKKLIIALSMFLMWAWSRYMTKVSRSARKWGSPVMGILSGSVFAAAGAICGITGAVGNFEHSAMPGVTPKRQSMVVNHPHGLCLWGQFYGLSRAPLKDSPYYGVFTSAADPVFAVPVFRELLLALGVRSANKKTMDGLFEQGQSVSLYPGGIHEQLATDPNQEKCFFPPKLGFVKQAIKHGVALQPIYCFGENQLFDLPDWARKVTQAVKKHTGIGMPIPIGRFGIPFLPKKTVSVGGGRSTC